MTMNNRAYLLTIPARRDLMVLTVFGASGDAETNVIFMSLVS